MKKFEKSEKNVKNSVFRLVAEKTESAQYWAKTKNVKKSEKKVKKSQKNDKTLLMQTEFLSGFALISRTVANFVDAEKVGHFKSFPAR